MSDGLGLAADALDGHAKKLMGLTDRLRGAVAAANTVSMPTDAYGILCQPFRMMLDPVEQWGLDSLKDAVTAMENSATNIKSTVKTYRENEEAARKSFKADK